MMMRGCDGGGAFPLKTLFLEKKYSMQKNKY